MGKERSAVPTASTDVGDIEVDLEDALDKVGMGKYQVLHVLLMTASLAATIIEMASNTIILPAASCDLVVPEAVKGIILTVHNIGTLLTGPLWGQAADVLGRKPCLIVSSAFGGSFCLLSAFMPNLLTFSICKLLGSLFLACPGSLGFAYASEFIPRKKRDAAVLACNALVTLAMILFPFLAWTILRFKWEYDIGFVIFRPWRLLTALYALPTIAVAILTPISDESPKFLTSKGKYENALRVLQRVYAVNTSHPRETYPVKRLKQLSENMEKTSEFSSEVTLVPTPKHSMLDILRPAHLKWLTLVSILMFGNSFLLPGLYAFSPDVLNKVILDGDTSGYGTVCLIINQVVNKTQTDHCVSNVSQDALLIMIASGFTCSLVVILCSICPVSKKTILIFSYAAVGACCLVAGLTTVRLVGSLSMMMINVAALSIGPLSAYTVELFPTYLRGKALSVLAMFGRLGSLAGASAAGFFLMVNCSATFWGFATVILSCAALSFFLPSKRKTKIADDLQLPNDSDIIVERL